MVVLRPARVTDVPGMLAIYGPFIEETTVSFETTVPSPEAFAERMSHGYPWLVADADGEVAGYAYASRHRGREAYQWSVETSVYVGAAHRRQGLARRLYADLTERLIELGYVNVYAGVTLPNDPSVAFHESFGFEKIGVYEKIGFKFGRWHDVVWFSRRLSDPDQPSIPRRFISR